MSATICARVAPRGRPRRKDRDVNLALKDLRHNVGRFLLTCLGLSLLLGIVLAMVGIYRGLIEEALGLARAAHAQVWVVEGGRRGPFAEASRMPGDTREAIAAHRDGCSGPYSRTDRTAGPRPSAELPTRSCHGAYPLKEFDRREIR